MSQFILALLISLLPAVAVAQTNAAAQLSDYCPFVLLAPEAGGLWDEVRASFEKSSAASVKLSSFGRALELERPRWRHWPRAALA